MKFSKLKLPTKYVDIDIAVKVYVEGEGSSLSPPTSPQKVLAESLKMPVNQASSSSHTSSLCPVVKSQILSLEDYSAKFGALPTSNLNTYGACFPILFSLFSRNRFAPIVTTVYVKKYGPLSPSSSESRL